MPWTPQLLVTASVRVPLGASLGQQCSFPLDLVSFRQGGLVLLDSADRGLQLSTFPSAWWMVLIIDGSSSSIVISLTATVWGPWSDSEMLVARFVNPKHPSRQYGATFLQLTSLEQRKNAHVAAEPPTCQMPIPHTPRSMLRPSCIATGTN
jgi:hypothetical protein